MTERSRRVEHDNARSEGTAKAGGWLAVAMSRLCNEVCGPKTLELATRFNALLGRVQRNRRSRAASFLPTEKI